MNEKQAAELIGIPYAPGAFGPDEFNCWGLLHYVQRNYFGVNLPEAPVGDQAACLAIARNCMETNLWLKVQEPMHGDGALLRDGSDPHVGVYLNFEGGGILHAVEGEGVVFTHLRSLNNLGYGRTTFYRFRKNA